MLFWDQFDYIQIMHAIMGLHTLIFGVIITKLWEYTSKHLPKKELATVILWRTILDIVNE